MSELFLYDDATARQFEPFALVRPVAELRAGATLLRERWETAMGRPCAGLVSASHLREFSERDAPRAVHDTLPAGAVLANSRCAVALANAPEADVWLCDGRVAAVRLRAPVTSDELAGGTRTLESLAPPSGRTAQVHGRWIDEVWHFIRDLPAQLMEDISALSDRALLLPPDEAPRVGEHPVFVERGATVEPMVMFDVTAGPVLIRQGAIVQAFTRLAGPCVVGKNSVVSGGRVATSSIGESCKVHGELSTSIILGHSNKGHDGFVGHSYLGRWVNLGAATVTSNLKNTYGTVSLWTPEGVRDTGLQFLGALIGDHAKTGIGVRLTTGSVIGAGANVFAGEVLPKVVPPFAWGSSPPYAVYDLHKFLTAADRMMQRRGVVLSERTRAQLSASHVTRWSVRQP